MPDYGYDKRQDQPPRVIPASDPPSRVTAPTNTESNRTRQAAKDALYLTSASPFATTLLLQGNETILVGRTAMIGEVAGGGGVSSDTRDWGWRSDIGRYCVRNRIVGLTSGAGGTYVSWRTFIVGVNPALVVDPKYSPTKGRGTWRIADTIRVVKDDTNGSARYWWGLGCNTNATLLDNPQPFLGFRVSLPGGLATGTWGISAIKSDGTTFLYNVDTHISAGDLHELAMELDGELHEVRFYIDGVLVGTYAPASGALGGEMTAGTPMKLLSGVVETGGSATVVKLNVDTLADGGMSAGWDFTSPTVAP